MTPDISPFHTQLAHTSAEREAAFRLRYRVFVDELGGRGDLVDHEVQQERDEFDPFCDHLLLIDQRLKEGENVVGVYRLLSECGARQAGGFYSEREFDLSALKGTGQKLLELGRSCLHPDYRGGTGMYQLWSALADYVQRHHIEVLFGVASFHGTNVAALAQPLSLLHHNHLAPPERRVKARNFQTMDLVAEHQLDKLEAIKATPALIKAYLRLGGVVGDGAYIDHAFNTTDVCLVMDTAHMKPRQSAIYSNGRASR